MHGVDCAERVEALRAGEVVPGVDPRLLDDAFATGLITFGTDFAAVRGADVVLLCVPTPLIDHRPDLSYIEKACREVAPHLSPGTLVVLESTTYAGTTEQVVRPLLEAAGMRSGDDFALAYSPERVDPGNPKFGFRQTPRIVGGVDPLAARGRRRLLRTFGGRGRTVSSARAAELAKLLENTFRMVNIALVNELAMLCAEQGINIWEVVDAAATKPFGFMPFYPGPGVGGHCIPLDPTYLSWQACRDTGRRLRLVETAQDINAQMPAYVARRVVDALNDAGRTVRDVQIFALGVTYKPDVGDVRESAAMHVLARLHARRGSASTTRSSTHRRPRGRHRAVELTDDSVEEADVVLLLTPHSSYDPAMLVETRAAVRRPQRHGRPRAGQRGHPVSRSCRPSGTWTRDRQCCGAAPGSPAAQGGGQPRTSSTLDTASASPVATNSHAHLLRRPGGSTGGPLRHPGDGVAEGLAAVLDDLERKRLVSRARVTVTARPAPVDRGATACPVR